MKHCSINKITIPTAKTDTNEHKFRIQEKKKIYRVVTKLVAATIASSIDLTIIGIFLQPGDLRIFCSNLMVACKIFSGHMSILVTTTYRGT